MTNFQMLQKSTALSLYHTIKLFATSKYTRDQLENVRCALKSFYHNPTNGMYMVVNNRMQVALKFYNLYH